jgi:hypothetical protein
MPEQSEEVKTETTTTAPVTDAVKTESPQTTAPDTAKMKSEEIKTLLEQKPEEAKPEVAETKTETKTPDAVKEEEWFDKEKGFKTKEDALKSYNELQNALRQRAEDQKRLQEELKSLKTQSEKRELTPEEKTREEAVRKWEEENKDAINFLEKRISERLTKKQAVETFEQEALRERNKWKEEFDKDDSRKVLWPAMEKIYSEKDIFQDFAKNPLQYIEAAAFQKEFPSIAERIRAEAIEQYKAQVKEAAEAEKRTKTEISGGAKAKAGDIDVTKLSSAELAKVLGRADD